MTSADHALLAAHQLARQSGVKPGDEEYERLLDKVAEQMVWVGDHDPELRAYSLSRPDRG